jgi:hypothetical protein
MSSPPKIERINQIIAVKYTAQAQVAAPGAVPGTVETEVTLPDGIKVPLNAVVRGGYIGTTPAARLAGQILTAYIKHSDATKLIFAWTQTAGAAAAVPAGEYIFTIAW